MRGRKPKPNHLHLVDGTARTTRGTTAVDLAEGDLREPPSDISPEARVLWISTIEACPEGLLRSIDVHVFRTFIATFAPPESKRVAQNQRAVILPQHSIDELKLGTHGVYIRKGNRSGTFLPQVATETGWSKEEFLGHCARDKAGLAWDGWKDAELYVYEALVFGENEH